MDFVNALSSNATAKAMVELPQNPQFQWTCTALNKSIAVECLRDIQIARLAAKTIEPQQPRKFYLLGTDVISSPRLYAETLPDRGFVYQVNTIKGKKPIVIGHPYSFLAALPERDEGDRGNSTYDAMGWKPGKQRIGWR
jgi:hypothetical protein